MAASVINVVETLCKDYPGLGVYVLKDVFDAIGDKITELASDTETGDDHGGN